jgi:hypothetical protein
VDYSERDFTRPLGLFECEKSKLNFAKLAETLQVLVIASQEQFNLILRQEWAFGRLRLPRLQQPLLKRC